MFEISRHPLITEIRCQECRASIEVNSDSRRLVKKSVTEFQKRHNCRGMRAMVGSSDLTGIHPGSPVPILI